jgi:uncharacterized protein YuzE
VRIEYDPQANAAYIYFTDADLTPGRDMVPLDTPPGVRAMVNMDWKDGRIVGLEVLGATALLHPDLLAQTTLPGES